MSEDDTGSARAVDLGRVSPARALFGLLHRRFTGTLALHQPEPYVGERLIHFVGGMPVYTDWFNPEDLLGEILLGETRITREQLDASLKAMLTTDKLLGEILVETGQLDEGAVARAMLRQCERKLVHVFGITEGQAVLTGGVDAQTERMPKVNTLGLIAKGVKRYYREARIVHEMRDVMSAKLELTPAFARYRSHFELGKEAEMLLPYLEKGSNYGSLVVRSGQPSERVAQTVYVLWVCQMLRAEPLQAGAAPPVRHATFTNLPRKGMPENTAPQVQGSAAVAMPSGAPQAVAAQASAPMQTAAEPSHENAAFLASLEALEAQVAEDAHAFDLLSLPLSATRADVRTAWAKLSKAFHPDSLSNRGLGELHERVSDVFAALSEAYAVLVDEKKREALRDEVQKTGRKASARETAEAARAAQSAFESELLAKEAEKLVRASKYPEAAERLHRALLLTPDEPELRVLKLWCDFQTEGRSEDMARQTSGALGEIINVAPNVARAHYYRGMALKALGDSRAALISFTRAFELDKRMVDAERQARAIKMNSPQAKAAQSSGKWNIKNLFGRKG